MFLLRSAKSWRKSSVPFHLAIKVSCQHGTAFLYVCYYPDQTMNSLTSLLLKEECLIKQLNRGRLDQQDIAFFIQIFHQEDGPILMHQMVVDVERTVGIIKKWSFKQTTAIQNLRLSPMRSSRTHHWCVSTENQGRYIRQSFRHQSRTSCHYCKRRGLSQKRRCNGRLRLHMSNMFSKTRTDFLVDSGATGHMTDQRSFFRSFIPILHDTWTVKGIGSYCLYKVEQSIS